MPDLTLFLTLRVFSATGGIEKVARAAGKAIQEFQSDQPGGGELKILSMYDEPGDLDQKYFRASVFKGFGKNKFRFVSSALRHGISSKLVVLSHVNLLIPGFLIKIFSPKTRLVLMAHGIEVWSPFSSWKNYLLQKCDQVLAVSSFTKDKLITVHGLNEKKISVLNNCLDPFLQPPLATVKNKELLQRYRLHGEDTVLMTLTRLSSQEQYKGYDQVLYAVNELKAKFPRLKYLLLGKYDETEKGRVDAIISNLHLQDQIIFAGFVPDEELAAHFNIADCYIMPSKKEGFGIVFIEALYYGKPVIAGNKDGSVDALNNGKFGLLVDPDDQAEIANAIIKVISNKTAFIPNHEEVMAKFSYEGYKEKLKKILFNA